ncbi:MAG: methionine--tRNA ligase subunit beta, partial [Bacteroidales bacterium]|nr:methionine--tRNA ligase subunit beta [Bacteroidales bacterium]
YISFTKQLKGDDWEKWWKEQDTKLVHFIGKDNIVFHCIIFPSMLHADGSYILPANVPANEFLNLEGDKISTSRNWAVWLHEYLKDFPGKQDVLRYVLCSNAPETKDNDFTWKDFQLKNNSELVAIFGNFVHRTLVLTHKYNGGKVPAAGTAGELELQLVKEMESFPERIGRAIETYHFRDALAEMMNLARLGNKYLTETEPWKRIKENPDEAMTALHYSLQICANLAILCRPFLPFTAEKLSRMLHLEAADWQAAGSARLLPEGGLLETPELLFEKVEDTAIDAQMQRLADTKRANEQQAWKPEPYKEKVSFEDFQKVDIRVGTVLECTKVPKADKLLQFLIDDGDKRRTIVSGIAQSYPEPEKLVGLQVCFIANFEPRKLKGVVSEGMLLSAADKDGRLVLLTTQSPVTAGVSVG